MAGNKTQPTDQNVAAFLAAIEHPTRREDAQALDQLFRDTTGYEPVIWGPSIVGYGRYHYTYKTGRQGDFLACGFAAQKARLSLYIMPGYQNMGDLLDRLGKHKTGAACLYINKLADVDMAVLAHIIRRGLKQLNATCSVEPR
jgi:uncharacterized protein DUF1801